MKSQYLLLTLVAVLQFVIPVQLGAQERTITDDDILPGQTVTWSADTTYLLSGRVFVDSLATLTIEAGTVIKGLPGDSIDASVLIVARGGKIMAEGTAEKPIIFTASSDDVTNPVDVAYDQKGLWGGVIILGRAPINRPAGQHNIEGIPTDEPRGLYGGDDPEDNSGVLRYVSIRHGGISIGFGNEINGLTMGGVGRGTEIDYVEVIANLDDGYEWFGGTVNCKHLISAFCGDDSFDHDEGMNCKMQFLFAIQHAEFGNMCGEHDGAPSSALTTQPNANVVIYNATYLGSGQNSSNSDQENLFKIRENWGGEYNNCIFGDYNGYGLDISSSYSPNDSKDRLDAGELKFLNNIWFKINGFTLADSIGKEDYAQAYLQDAAHGNVEADPMLHGISRTQDGNLDPRPMAGSPAFDNLAAIPNDSFFENVDYKGAFGPSDMWAGSWTALYHYGILSDNVLPVEEPKQAAIPRAFDLQQNYPNPFNPATEIRYTIPENGHVSLSVYTITGQKVGTLVNTYKNAGSYHITWNAAGMASGYYFYRLEMNGRSMTRKMLYVK